MFTNFTCKYSLSAHLCVFPFIPRSSRVGISQGDRWWCIVIPGPFLPISNNTPRTKKMHCESYSQEAEHTEVTAGSAFPCWAGSELRAVLALRTQSAVLAIKPQGVLCTCTSVSIYKAWFGLKWCGFPSHQWDLSQLPNARTESSMDAAFTPTSSEQGKLFP